MDKEFEYQSNPTDNYDETKETFNGRVCPMLEADYLVQPVFDSRHFEEWICPVCEAKLGESGDSEEDILQSFKRHTISNDDVASEMS